MIQQLKQNEVDSIGFQQLNVRCLILQLVKRCQEIKSTSVIKVSLTHICLDLNWDFLLLLFKRLQMSSSQLFTVVRYCFLSYGYRLI